MNKLRHADVLPALSTSFTSEVRQLAADAKELSKSYADLTERMLKFAERIMKLWEKASSLDGNKDNGQHKAHFLKALEQVVNTDNHSIWSRWVTIGKHAKDLLPYKAALPPQRDSLYAVALANKEGKPLVRWIDDGKLTAESTMREVQILCRKKKHKGAQRSTPRNVASITLHFNSYDAAAKTLQDILASDSTITVTSHEAFRQALKALLGPEYAKVADRLT
jgi:hypothetical protein